MVGGVWQRLCVRHSGPDYWWNAKRRLFGHSIRPSTQKLRRRTKEKKIFQLAKLHRTMKWKSACDFLIEMASARHVSNTSYVFRKIRYSSEPARYNLCVCLRVLRWQCWQLDIFHIFCAPCMRISFSYRRSASPRHTRFGIMEIFEFVQSHSVQCLHASCIMHHAM